MMERLRSRGVWALVVGVVLAAALVTPSVAHHTAAHTGRQISQIVERLTNQSDRTLRLRDGLVDHRDRLIALEGQLRAQPGEVFGHVDVPPGQSETLIEFRGIRLVATCTSGLLDAELDIEAVDASLGSVFVTAVTTGGNQTSGRLGPGQSLQILDITGGEGVMFVLRYTTDPGRVGVVDGAANALAGDHPDASGDCEFAGHARFT